MKLLYVSLAIGLAAGVLDIVPMIIQKLEKRAIVSAFLQYLFVSIVIVNISLPVVWWLKGGIVSFALALPVLVIVSGKDKKAVSVIAGMSVILGTLIAAAGHFFYKYFCQLGSHRSQMLPSDRFPFFNRHHRKEKQHSGRHSSAHVNILPASSVPLTNQSPDKASSSFIFPSFTSCLTALRARSSLNPLERRKYASFCSGFFFPATDFIFFSAAA